jgi:exosortase
MRLIQIVRSSDKRPRSDNPLTHQLRALIGLLSKRASGFLIFNILYGSVFAAYFVQFFRFSLEQEYTPHFSLILLVSLYLMHARKQALCTQAEYCVPGGLPFVLVGLLCYMLGLELRPELSPHDCMALTALGIITVWVGGFVTFFGLPATRIALFPLSFLIFIIPLPEALLFHIITGLQYASAEVVSLLFQLCPIPFTREGLYFSLPDLHIEVARECSSIRSSLALCIACVLANHLLLHRWWSKAAVLLLVFPLAVFKNGVRIVSLSLLTLYVDKGFMASDLHSRGGVVFFGLALAMLLPIFLGLRKLELRHADPGQELGSYP